jgi:hypothetical protein
MRRVNTDGKGFGALFFFSTRSPFSLKPGVIVIATLITAFIQQLYADGSDLDAVGEVTSDVSSSIRSMILVRGVRDYNLDDTFIIPGTFGVTGGTFPLREGSEYTISYPEGIVHLLFEPVTAETLAVSYQNCPLMIPIRYLSSLEILPPVYSGQNPSTGAEIGRVNDREVIKSPSTSLFSISGAKGFSVGRRNGGEFTMDQSLDLSVNGRLPGGTSVDLQLSDQSIPISGGGSSVELRELDQISFRVRNGPASATLGDYHYSIDDFEFARVERKLEGVRGEWTSEDLSISGAGAVSPGKFTSCSFDGREGKQGPYRLVVDGIGYGDGFVVLANTERVYLDGELMVRGEGKDYTIDYNGGTITFTSRRLISGDSRIEVDFEYSESGGRGTFYSTTFSTRSIGHPLGIRGYILREVDHSDTSSLGENPSVGGMDDRMGLAYDYETDFGFRMEGEGSYQSERPSGGSVGSFDRSSGAFWMQGGFNGISLFDKSGNRDRWNLSWYEKEIGDAFSFSGRRYEPDFHWKWGLSPEPTGRETWRILDLGVDLQESMGLGVEWGRIRRDDGEFAFRKRVRGSVAEESGIAVIEGDMFSINSMRTGNGVTGDPPLQQVDITGRSVSVSRKVSGWTPSFTYSYRSELVDGGDIRGENYDEIKPSIQGLIAGKIATNLGFRMRENRSMESGSRRWRDESQLFQGRADLEYRGGLAFRVRGSTEYRLKRQLGESGGDITTILGRGEFLTAGWDRGYSTSTTYEMNSTSNVLQRAIFIPEKEDEGDYLEDGTFVGPGNGTHVRQTVPDVEGEGQVIGASLTSVQNLDLSSMVAGGRWSLATLMHTSTLSVRHERVGDNRWRIYLFLPAGSGGGRSNLYRSLEYRGEFEGVWGDEQSWTTVLDLEFLQLLDRRYSNLDQDYLQRSVGVKVGGAVSNRMDLELDFSTKRRLDESSFSQTTDLREKRIGSELGYRSSTQIRYFLALDLGANTDRVTGTNLRDGTVGPGVDLFFGGGGNLNLQYRLERLWTDDLDVAVPAVMMAGRDIGSTHHYQLRANWRLNGSLNLTASLTGRKRPGSAFIENTGRTDFTYRF